MFKLLVLCCLAVGCMAGPFGFPSWIKDVAMQWQLPRGCANRTAGVEACARVNNTDMLAPHPHDCRLFFYCSSSGAPPVCRKCSIGLQFNPKLEVCDWPKKVKCISRPPRPPRRPCHNGTTPDPTTSNADATDAETSTSDSATDLPNTNAPSTATNNE